MGNGWLESTSIKVQSRIEHFVTNQPKWFLVTMGVIWIIAVVVSGFVASKVVGTYLRPLLDSYNEQQVGSQAHEILFYLLGAIVQAICWSSLIIIISSIITLTIVFPMTYMLRR